MAKRKKGKKSSSPQGAKSKKPGKPKTSARKTARERMVEAFGAPDWASLESTLHQLFDPDAGLDEELTPAEKLLEDAYEAPPEEQVQLAQQALAINPDCADAYALLAENAGSREEALKLFREAVAAGRRALGEQFDDLVGHFWGHLPTRPYMQAMSRLANELLGAGQHVEAVRIAQEMLRLNPNDNQGMRDTLIGQLALLGRNDEMARLLETFTEDSSACWEYSQALLAFRQEGDSPVSRKALKKAHKANKHVPAYMVGHCQLPPVAPEYYDLGDESEAQLYVGNHLAAWKATPGAVPWVRATLKLPLHAPQQRETGFTKQQRNLWRRMDSLEDEVWQAGLFELEDAPLPGEHATFLLICDSTGKQRVADLLDADADDEDLREALLTAATQPMEGEPGRPVRIEISDQRLLDAWGEDLQATGTEADFHDELPQLRSVAEMALERLAKLASTMGSDEAIDESLLEDLPASNDVWQVGYRQLPMFVNDEDSGPARPWCTMVLNGSDHLIHATNLTTDEPTPDEVWQSVARSMAHPVADEPRRPQEVQFAQPMLEAALSARLRQLGIRAQVVQRLDFLDSAVDGLAQHLMGPGAPAGLMEVPGIAAEQVGDVYAAAADYYRRTPWRTAPGDAAIEIRSEALTSGPWYAVVMGQIGTAQGLSLHEGLEPLASAMRDQLVEGEYQRRLSALSITFGEAFEISPIDLQAGEAHGWTVAGPEAYPTIMRIKPGMAMRSPLGWELKFLAAALRAVPEFAASHRQAATITANTFGGPMTLNLAWIEF